MESVPLSVAFSAGVLSFFAPCLLPLFPAYISFITGVSVSELQNQQHVRQYQSTVLLNSLLYCLGFSVTFVVLGLVATSIGLNLNIMRPQLIQYSGGLVILFGLYMLGAFRFFQSSQREYKFPIPSLLLTTRYLGAFLLGVSFALAWTPCIGAILGTILTLAASSSSVGQGALLLFVYSLGISLPFLLIAVSLSWSFHWLQKVQRILPILNTILSLFFIGVGVLMVMQKLYLLDRLF